MDTALKSKLRARIGVCVRSIWATMVLMSLSSQSANLDAMPGMPISPAVSPLLDSDAAWKQVQARDPQARFFYAVTTTGVFCRPGCTSRRPLRANVRFFATAAEAQAAGFRPCRRCRPIASSRPLDEIRAHIESHLDRPVRLAELGRIASLSPFTVQRLFKREMGVSPLQYRRALKAGRLRQALKGHGRVTDAIYDVGFGSSSRAYEANQFGMTPARFAQGGKGEQIGWATAQTPFGWMIVGATGRGLCWLSLTRTRAQAEASLREEFPAAELRRDPSLARWIDAALKTLRKDNGLVPKTAAPQGPECCLDLRGTVFQLRVWQALRQIPRGETRSYSEVARQIGDPKAIRAVARACAVNRVALLVPCHRVVGANGAATGYRWGIERKRQLLKAERA